MWQICGGLLVGLGLVGLGVYIGLVITEAREDEARAAVLLAQLEERRRPVGGPPWPELEAPVVAAYYLPGYAGPFPRAGRFELGPDQLGPLTGALAEMAELEAAFHDVPDITGPRPIPSPVDLDRDVRRMCNETEAYVSELIEGTRHAQEEEQ